MQVTTVLTWKAYVEKKLRTSEINANIKQTSWILWKKGKTEGYWFYCCHTVFVAAFLVHGPVTQATYYFSLTFHDTFLLCNLVPFAFVCVFFLIPCKRVTEVAALNNTWLCHSIHCMDQQWGFSKLYYHHKRMEKISHGHASTRTICFWCKCTKGLRMMQYDYCM